jgi:hypothetical protein
MRFVILFPFVLAPFALFACSAAPLPKDVSPGERDPVTVEARFARSELGASEIVEFRFPEGSAALSAEARKSIEGALAKTGKLADQRLQAIRKAIAWRTRGIEEVSTHNMAKTASTMERLLQPPDYRVKEFLQDSGAANDEKEGTPMKGKGIVMLVRALGMNQH